MTPILGMTAIVAVLCMAGDNGHIGQGHGAMNSRTPPYWHPDDHSYSFRAWVTDLQIWLPLTELRPSQQGAAIITRLGGTAREFARTITPYEMSQGGVINGVQLDPLTYIVERLRERFAPLDTETRMNAMTELIAFQRRPNETIDSLITRFDLVRHRAVIDSNFVMPAEFNALQFLRCIDIQQADLMQLLAPLGHRLPNTEQELQLMFRTLRRTMHIHEGARGNIVEVVRGHLHQAPRGAYTTQQQEVPRSGHPHTTAYPVGQAPWFGIQSGNSGGGGYSSDAPWYAASSQGQQDVYLTDDGDQSDASTDTDTSSDSGRQPIPGMDIGGLSTEEASQHLYFQYRNGKRAWRRFTGKPVR